jgi:hypothetical protein
VRFHLPIQNPSMHLFSEVFGRVESNVGVWFVLFLLDDERARYAGRSACCLFVMVATVSSGSDQ